MTRPWRRLRGVLQRARAESETNEELAFHLEMETRKNLQAGMSPAEARRAALLAFGGVERFREEVRETRSARWWEELRQDLRLAGRTLRRSPGFALVAVLTLALGIGAATTMFGVFDAVVLRPLALPEPERLVHVWETTPDGEDFTAAAPNFLDFRRRSRTLAGLAAHRQLELTYSAAGPPERLQARAVTHDLLAVLGVRPAVGRGFRPEEDRPGGDTRRVLLGQELWRSRFGGDEGVVGRKLTLDGEPYEVVGVLPALPLLAADLWVPLAPDPHGERDDHWLDMVGRLAPGATREEATAELRAVAASIGVEHPKVRGWGVRMLPLDEWLVEPQVRQASGVLLGAVALLLLLACINVASLMLARATTRRTELGIRVALGAGRARLVRQLLTESALFAALAGGLGLLVAGAALAAARRLEGRVPRIEEAGIDARVALFSLAAAVLTTLLVGALPALGAARSSVRSALALGARSGGSRGQQRLREALVVGQVTLAVVLLIAAGLLGRSLRRLERVDPGFATERVWAAPLQLTTADYDEPWRRVVLYERVLERVRSLPGVAAAAGTNITPFGDWSFVNDVTPEELAAETPSGGYLQAAWRTVTTGYFAAAGVPLLRGRDFDADDRHGRLPVAVVSRSLAAALWPGRDPVGRRFYWGGTDGEPWTVIGVAGDIRDVDPAVEPLPTAFFNTRQVAWPHLTLLVRTRGPVAGVTAAVRQAVWTEDPSLAVPEVTPLAAARGARLADRRFHAYALAGFAAAALLLAALGLYAVLAYAVAQRRREIGVRMALGARAPAVIGMLLRRGLLLTAAGVALALLVATVSHRLVEGILFEIDGTDPLTYVAVATLFGVVGTLATVLPARRAARTSPLVVLRDG